MFVACVWLKDTPHLSEVRIKESLQPPISAGLDFALGAGFVSPASQGRHHPETRTNESVSPSSLHSSGGLAFLASRGSSQDVVLVLWLRGHRRTERQA